jgi:hypothetical protein
MEVLLKVLRYEMILLLVLLAGVVGYKLLVNQINVKGLLRDKTGDRSFSPASVQLLGVTLSVATYYMFMVIEAKGTGRLPDMPNEFLFALMGSNSIFLAGKLYGALTSKLRLALSPIRPENTPKPED